MVTLQAGGDYFFIYTWAFTTVVMLFLMTVYPDFIAPLFDKYTELPEGELRTRIEALASQLEYPLKKLYIVEGEAFKSASLDRFQSLTKLI